MITNLAPFTDTATGWQRALYAFLAEKEQRSGSRRTVEGYSRMLQDFFGRSGKLPNQVTSQDIFVYAHNLDGQKFWADFGWKPRHDLLIMQHPASRLSPH